MDAPVHQGGFITGFTIATLVDAVPQVFQGVSPGFPSMVRDSEVTLS